MHRALIALVGLFLSVGVAVAEDRPEFRAAWVTRFDWPDRDPQRCKENIIRVMETAVAANLNAVVFQVRGEAETLYPSELEPWSPLIGGKDPGFDPLALAVAEAHERGLQLHAYINAMPLCSTRNNARPPADPNHLYHAHGPDAADSWVCRDAQGRPTREEYIYLSPAVPEVHAYLRKVITDVVARYDVDGIHLDRVRYPGPEYIHDPIGERRFYERGNPNLRDRADWQREQLDKFINDLAAEIRAIRPACVLSCSAWGIYNRHHIEGYDEFSSGFHDYYQDTWHWCRLGAMDLLMPMIYWNIPSPKPNYDEVMKDFVDGVGSERVVGGQRIFSPGENAAQVQAGRDLNAAGAIFFTLGRARRAGVLDRLSESLYATRVAVPVPARIAQPETGDILGTVTTEDGTPLADAWVSLVEPQSGRDRRSRRGSSPPTWTSSADGRFAFLGVSPGPVKIRVHYVGAAPVESAPIEVEAGRVAKVEIAVPGGEQARHRPFVQILAPRPGHETTAEVVHVLGRTSPGTRVQFGDEPVEVFSTGAFARDGIPLAVGENKLAFTVTDSAGQTHVEELIVVRREPPASQARAEERPSADPAPELWSEAEARIGEANGDGVGITYGLHSVRLGGPWLTRTPKGTRFKVVGRQGGNFKIALSNSLTGYISAREVSLLPEGTPVPHNYFTSCEVNGNETHDTVSIALREKVVFAIRSETMPCNRLLVDFFDTHHALTWISHKSGAQVIGPVTGEQIEENRFRLTLPVRGKQIWGYWTETNGNVLRIHVRRPPKIAAAPDSPLRGLLFALEAGHGGSNSGAVGHMGTKEKTINAEAVRALQQVLEQRGARTVLVRPGDSSPTLQERVDRANAAGADFFVSIHANAAGNTRGYLSVSGTSTYYTDPHCHLPAELVYRRLLDLGWREFGVVGNFSYYPLTNTRVPGILVEQAFMSNPYDEARMLDPDYQRQQAEAIAAGLEDFFAQARPDSE
ncbi:MAG TPA: family 10 glycosylhydrolase [Phycisphaerae bacterium]|nr:family 10 glycosylhydrolase [Phycisphaerae bacterium]HOJ72717.1 family 10 glycosylhydrolase [Phycisphaerae bacterium]HOM53500.1 family 10 glycosylhydrolase [Phycisphaerae bacterium]HON66977.1 family 10 glycosylhydrolase [Phycisphaerae bacterium]HPP26918.1 family 10 glycosylhydrolase [Phycisphaerae bacterium]